MHFDPHEHEQSRPDPCPSVRLDCDGRFPDTLDESSHPLTLPQFGGAQTVQEIGVGVADAAFQVILRFPARR